ncbi:MAG: DUF1761 domain-containing protein [Novosphingobium sp.]
MGNISWLAVVLAAASGFLIGGLWYGPLFLKTWQREAGIGHDEMSKRHPAWVFGGAFVLQLVAAVMLAHMYAASQVTSLRTHLMMASGIAIAFIATAIGVNYLFAGKSVKLWAIDAGYYLVTYTLMGAIFAYLG